MQIKKRVLIVDDDPDILELIDDKLSGEGFETIAVPDGKSAARIAPYFNPNLLILDILMPRMDGWETLQRVRQSAVSKDVPAIVITGCSDTRTLMKGKDMKVLDVYFKPFALTELAGFVKKVLS